MTAPQALFINSDRIGDCVMFSGVIEALRRRYPGVEITLACGPTAAPLFRATPNVVRVIPWQKKKASGHWFDLLGQAWNTRWDCVVDIRGSGLAYLLRARDRRIYNRRWETGLHKVETASRLMGFEQTLPPEIDLDEAARSAAAGVIGADKGAILAFAPISTATDRSWPAARWGGLIERLKAEPAFDGWRFMAIGGPGDQAAAAPALAAAGPRGINFVGQGDILSAAAALDRAQLFVGNDSGLMHVSAAMGTPTLGLFGPSEWWHKAPYGDCGRVLAAAPVRGHFASIEVLDVDRVFSAVMDLKAAFHTPR